MGTREERTCSSEPCTYPLHHTLLTAQGLEHTCWFEVRKGHVRNWGCSANLMGPSCRVLAAVSRSERMQVLDASTEPADLRFIPA